MIRTLLCVGHLSPFGKAFLLEAVTSSFFEIENILIPDEQLYIDFTCRLKQLDQLENERKFRKKYRQETRSLRSILKEKAPDVEIVVCSTIENELAIEKFHKCELAFCAAFPAIFPESVITIPKRGIVNFHPSYLPRCRGAHPVYWTIASGEPYGGVSAHFMTTKIDAGPIVARRKIAFDPETVTYQELYQKVVEEIPPLLMEVAAFFKTEGMPLDQDEQGMSYFRENLPIHQKIYWEKETARQISAKIRAGGAYAFLDGEKIWFTGVLQIVKKVPFVTNGYDDYFKPGTILKVESKLIWIKCLSDYMEVSFHRSRTVENLLMTLLMTLRLKSLGGRFSFLQKIMMKPGRLLY